MDDPIYRRKFDPDGYQAHPRHVGHLWNVPETATPRLLSVVKSTCPSGYIGGGACAVWLLNYSLTPFGRLQVGSRQAEWRRRDAFEAHLYPPRTWTWEDTTSADVTHTHGILITFAGGEHAGLSALVRERGYARFLDPAHRLCGLLEHLFDIGVGLGNAGFWPAQADLCGIIALLKQAVRSAPGIYRIPQVETEPRVPEFLQKAREYLQHNLSAHITRKDMAAQFNLSVAAFAHRYREAAHESPLTTLTRMRIHLAKCLILKGHPLKNVAPETGFCDAYHLSKVFKRVAGVSVREFLRRQTRQAGNSQLLPWM